MRILWSSNGLHTSTGYGTQTKYAIQHLSELGHEMANFAWYGLKGSELHAGDVVMYPRVNDMWGRDATPFYARHFRADALVTLMDIWVLSDQLGGNNFAERLPCPWVAWFPVDGEPASPLTVEMAKQATYPVVYSRFAERQMAEAGMHCDYIPHGINCDVFSRNGREEARARFQVPDGAFLISMVAANNDFPSRKAIPENLAAFKRFHDRYPESILYLHTDMKPQANPGGGQLAVNVHTLMDSLNIEDGSVWVVDQDLYRAGMISDQYMADVYRASDVFLLASCGEGFGLPIAEAQACGCPVVTTDFSAMSELTVNGIATEPLKQRRWLPGGFWQALPDIDAILEALVAIRNWSDKKRRWKSMQGAKHIRENYAWPFVTKEYWKPFLEKVESELW